MSGRDLAAEARDLDAEARRHKREERRHRMAARDAREKLAAIERECARLGITLSINSGEGTVPWPKTSSSTSIR
ncbi:hypothetical protein [Sinorhizobium medicae]|uniref:hypothetical protein n=1 Tax=Sinorhizobium medicae TaxID=110321 RepID=UPI000FE02AC9|nr:hypothetical protein [Sinorhizobium medicae]RVQ76114.1 hypothetical protein CN244_06295 [Sinorhizobium medicae]